MRIVEMYAEPMLGVTSAIKRVGFGVLIGAVVFGAPGSNASATDHAANSGKAKITALAGANQEYLVFMSLDEMFPDPAVREVAAAAGKGDLKAVERLVASGVNVNSRGTKDATPLFWSMRNLAGFTKLLELGADPNVVFGDGGTVMHWAAGSENLELLKVALKHGGNPNLVAGDALKTPVFHAIASKISAVESLLDAGANLNVRSTDGTPAMVAAALARFDVVYVLLVRGADYSIAYPYGDSLVRRIARKRALLDPNHELTAWMRKVIAWLAERGVVISDA